MMAKRIGELLVDAGVIDEAKVRAALVEQRRTGKLFGRAIIDLDLADEHTVIKVLAAQLGVPTVSLDARPANTAALALLDPQFCRANECLPFEYREQGRLLSVAMADPKNAAIIARIRARCRRNVKAFLAGPRELERAFARELDRPTHQDHPAALPGEPVLAFGGDDQAADAAGWETPEETGGFEIDFEEPDTGARLGAGVRSVPGLPTRPDYVAVSPDKGKGAPGRDRPEPLTGRPRLVPKMPKAPAARAAAPAPASNPRKRRTATVEVQRLRSEVEALTDHVSQLGRQLEAVMQRLDARTGPPASPTPPASPRVTPPPPPSVRTAALRRPAADAMDTSEELAVDDDAAVIVNTPSSVETAVQGRPPSGGDGSQRFAARRRPPSLPIPAASGVRPVVVIDFGTTRSSVAVVREGRAEALPLPGNRWDMPSVVAFCEDGSATVGEAAREMLPSHPTTTVASPKRLLGQLYDAPGIQPYLAELTMPSTRAQNGEVLLHIRDRVVTLPEICSYVLKTLRIVAERAVGGPVENVVLTIPVGFDDRQKQALVHAARMAELSVSQFIEEPVAAALSNHGDARFGGLVAVYDFGGGTFDFAVVDVGGEDLAIVTTAGDSWLGGDDFDTALAGEAANWFWRQHQIELRKQLVQWQRLLFAAEGAKQKLSESVQAAIRVPGVALTTRGPLNLEFPLTRRIFEEEALRSLIGRSIETCREGMELAGVRPAQLNAVFLSGGTSRIPAVRQAVTSFFGKEPVSTVPPERAVLLGAALCTTVD